MPLIEVRLQHGVASSGPEQVIVGKKSEAFPDLDEFRGIPFGHIPGRWKRSELRTTLPSNRFEAFRDGPKCPQPREANHSNAFLEGLDFADKVPDSEFECLNLFIVRPSQEALARIGAEDRTLPVLIWIHGGAYAFGAGSDPMWDPSALVQRSIELGKPFIAAFLNYRLNYFGFAASAEILEDQPLGCNFGLYDQRIGIKWVSHHIGAFGGDPAAITIAGQSAGASSTNIHALDAKFSAGAPLFRRVILQSGSIGILGPVPLKEAQKQWDTVCRRFSNGSSTIGLSELRKVSCKEVLSAMPVPTGGANTLVLDGKSIRSMELVDGVEVDLDCVGRNLADQSEATPIEVMLGDCDAEGSIFAHPDMKRKIQTLDDVQGLFGAAFANPSAIQEILEMYALTKTLTPDEIHRHLIKFLSDCMFGVALYKARKSLEEYQGDTTVRPTITKPFKVKFGNPFKASKNYGVSHHCVELIYIFDAFHKQLEDSDTDLNQPAKAAQQTMLDSSTQPTNCQLRDRIQEDWIDFITKETSRSLATQQDEIVVYDRDRSVRTGKFSQDEGMLHEERRFLVLDKHWEEVMQVRTALMRGSF